MTLLTKAQILDNQTLNTVDLEIPEFGGTVRLKEMTGYARDKFEASCQGRQGGADLVNIRAKMAAASIVNDKDELMFAANDIVKLGKLSAKGLDRIIEAATKLNSMGDDEIEALAKN